MIPAIEVNFDGIVGPTHNYAGLAHGNLASQKFKKTVSNPRAAALEGLAKMKKLAELGVMQAVLPPQDRPAISVLRGLGLSGSDAAVLEKAWKADPVLLAACSSASGMWAANAATVSPSGDTADHRLHLTPANLVSQLHRSIEAPATLRILQGIFDDPEVFCVHSPVPGSLQSGDEGAANHIRLGPAYGDGGLEIFVYGQCATDLSEPRPMKFPARQTREASEAIARLHQLSGDRVLFVQQNPAAIDAGIFHNDVAAVGNLNVLMFHELAYADPGAINKMRAMYEDVFRDKLFLLEAKEKDFPLAAAVETYLFNSQLILQPGGKMALIAPIECQSHPTARGFIERIIAEDNPVALVEFVDVRQSMQNGGGPACLRLRVVMNELELTRVRKTVFLDDVLFTYLSKWIERHYRESLAAEDLADPLLLTESRTALDELTKVLGLGSVYEFQRG